MPLKLLRLAAAPGVFGSGAMCRKLTSVWNLKINIKFGFKLDFPSFARTIWLVGCFWFNGPLRQYFSLYLAVSQREGEREEKRIDESKNVQTTPARTYYKRSRSLPYCNPNCRTPRHWKFTQHHSTTRPLPQEPQSVNKAPKLLL